MNWEDFRTNGKALVDYIADYLETIRTRNVFPNVKPGYMKDLLPDAAPAIGESWQQIFADVERVIMPGITHWQSPFMHAYFPALNCPASLLGDMLANAIGALGFTWASCPAATELEIIVMDWLGQMLELPDEFLHSKSNGNGGGVIQTTASEATFVALLAARTEMIRRIKDEMDSTLDDAYINSRLVGYCSDQAHSSVEKAGLIGLVQMRYIESDESFALRGDRLVEVIQQDKEQGLIPFFLCATLGTTGCCAFDNIKELGPIANEEHIWIHVDAAYAGTAFICPEYQSWLSGVELVQSIAFNPSKWMMVHFDCTAMWVKNSSSLHRTFNVDPLYLQHENTGLAVDFMHWQIPLSKRFRALKLWFVIRNYGVKGLQNHVRRGVRLAMAFEELVKSDARFEIPAKRHLGMVVFRLKGHNELTECLLKKLNSSGKLHCVPASLRGTYVIRFTVTSNRTELADIQRDWYLIKEMATIVLKTFGADKDSSQVHRGISLAEIKKKSPAFGTSLLLSNSPMTPKIINASFMAIFDTFDQEFANDYVNYFGSMQRLGERPSPALRRRIKGLMLTDKQHSLDSRIDLMNSIVATVNNYKKGKKTSSSYADKIKTHSASSAESIQEVYEANESNGEEEADEKSTE